MDKKQYTQHIKNAVHNKTLIACAICAEDNPQILRKIEAHHVFAKTNSQDTCYLCPNCHTFITHKQNQLSPTKRSRNATKIHKIAYSLLTQGALLELIGKNNQKTAQQILEDAQ